MSTHPGEEELCLEIHKILQKKFTNIITIIIPRHISRANDIKKICGNFGLNAKIHDLNDEMTIIMVAHRLSTLKNCSRIIRIEGGNLIIHKDFEK